MSPSPDSFPRLEEAWRSHGPAAVFEALICQARESHDHRLLFDTRILQTRHAMGLPLIETEPLLPLQGDELRAYEDGFRRAAREAGELYLADGDIAGAWPYFQAVGDRDPVAAAIEKAAGGEQIHRIIEIAFREEVNQRRGFELILEHEGICRAITMFGQVRQHVHRQHALALLVRRMHADLAGALRETITANEPAAPTTGSVPELIQGREWLFEGNSSYVDSTHLSVLLRYTPELEGREALRLALELAEYGTHLAEMFHFRGEPPFEDTYGDHAIYLRALLGEDVDPAIEHFRRKITDSQFPGDNTPAEVLVDLLVKLNRHAEAIGVAQEYLPDAGGYGSSCPSVVQLCQMAGDFERLREVARQRGNLTAFAAALIQADGAPPQV